MRFLFVAWQVLAGMWLTTILCQLTEHIRGLPLQMSVTLPQLSSPRTQFEVGFTLGILLPVSKSLEL